tara:strand:- start:202 stop:381 length:180 start_codon:yes stop_codon:yes gene_type:complete
MNLPFLYIVDGALMISIFYACFCVKTQDEKEVEINLHTPLKNDNYLNYDEVDIEALYND